MVVLDTKHMETYQLYMTPIIIIGVPVGSYHHENSTFPSRSSSQRLLLCKQKIAALSKDGCSEQNILSALPAEGKLIKLKYFQIIFCSCSADFSLRYSDQSATISVLCPPRHLSFLGGQVESYNILYYIIYYIYIT